MSLSLDIRSMPSPIRYGSGLRMRRDAHFIIEPARHGDVLDLTTCDACIARVIHGIRYDTQRAFLVASRSGFDNELFFGLRQIFRGYDHRWFALQVQLTLDSGACNTNLIMPIPDERVLPSLRQVVRDEDCWPFLRDWYCMGWIPRNDAFAQAWAEAVLPADDCQFVINSFGAIPSDPNQ